MAEDEEELKSLLMKVKEESENAGLKLNFQKMKIMASSPITSQMGKQWKQWQTLFSWAPKSTADGDCSHETKRRLLLGKKVRTNLSSILKSRDITLPTKFRLVKAMVYPVVMYECENWTMKNAEHWWIDVLELWFWRRLLRAPWTTRKSNQSIFVSCVWGNIIEYVLWICSSYYFATIFFFLKIAFGCKVTLFDVIRVTSTFFV